MKKEEQPAYFFAVSGEFYTPSRGEKRMIDRAKTSQALAKAIAFKQCGKDADAAHWAKELVRLLELSNILKGE